jgi:hypothetical protein
MAGPDAKLTVDMRLLLVAQMRTILRRKPQRMPINEMPIPVAFDPASIYCESAVEGNCAARDP